MFLTQNSRDLYLKKREKRSKREMTYTLIALGKTCIAGAMGTNLDNPKLHLNSQDNLIQQESNTGPLRGNSA